MRRFSSFIALVVSVLLGGTALHVQAADEAGGPVPLRNQFPLFSAHLSMLPQGAAVTATGSIDGSLSSAWSNTFIIKDSYTVDAESVELRARGRFGVARFTELSIELPFVWMGGGTLDGPIDEWHKFWGFPRGKRGARPRDSFDISGLTQAGAGFELAADGMRLGNPVIGGKRTLFSDSSGAGALIAEIAVPAVASGYAHDGTDLGVGAVFTDALSWGSIHYGAELFWHSAQEYSGVPIQPIHGEAFFAVEREVWEGVSLLGTLSAASQTVHDIAGFPEYSIYLDLGTRVKLGASTALVAAFRENPAPHDGTTDISFFAQLEQKIQ